MDSQEPAAPTEAGPAESIPDETPAGLARTIALNRAETGPLFRHLGLPSPGQLSPLPGLTANGKPSASVRDFDDILHEFQGLSTVIPREALTPLAIPDRVVDARSALFNSAPTQCRLYSSRRCGDKFAGLRPAFKFDYELLAPFTPADLQWWVQVNVQFSAGQPMPIPRDELTAEEFAFLLLLVDAYKTSFVRSFAGRREDPVPLTVSVAGILEAQNDALKVADRRFLGRAVGELFATIAHPGGVTAQLPVITQQRAEHWLNDYANSGYLERSGPASRAYKLGLAMATFAGSLFTWISMLTLHDIQLTGWRNGRASGQEELLLFITTEPTIWTVATQGLTASPTDWSRVRFGLRALGIVEACNLTRTFLTPIPDVTLPDSAYEPLAQPPAAKRPAPAAPAWRPTHVVRDRGAPAFAVPDTGRPPVASIDSGVELQILERRGTWVYILCNNGWKAWVDQRTINELPPRAPVPPTERATQSIKTEHIRMPSEPSRPVARQQEPSRRAAPPQEPSLPPLPPERRPWRPTHIVPAGGMPAWTTPDPSDAPTVRIDPGVELQLLERSGHWAHIVCNNGWKAWVDGRDMDTLRRP
jgi:hypothetical protein